MAHVLEAKPRPDLKKSVSKKLRKEGYVPAVLYGKETESTTVAVPSIELIKTLREVGRNGIIDLNIEGTDKKHQVIVHDLQVDNIKDELIHADFYEVDMKSEMESEVNVTLVGDAPGERDGGIVSHLLYTLTVRALPAEFPEEIKVDISDLNIGDVVQVGDLPENSKYTIMNEPEETIVTVLPPEQHDTTEETEEVAEPELVGAEDKEEEKEEE
ncbi:50S ribosomal protein L25/general stress protein Ctc [Aliibacillus thermotolerans]|uniref:Large ribosomal subunit protein bL25 n=1 Tax=Aliibacillus thermotolerans TaxID=1834418 RepID=A0ABW0U6G4_9BACI|nr:50S ribosomal protein L25/general stress protein Ctc [Aliibacillus thermotolerans]MDA3128857.1 50S ribosomal protein L25/general stress protein Ctc [Aliibacillus thermotolerans]